MKRLNLNARINLLIIGQLILIISILGVYVYQNLRTKILEQVHNQYQLQVDAILSTLNIQNKANVDKLTSNLKGLDILIKQNFEFTTSPDSVDFDVVELLTFLQQKIKVQFYLVNGVPINTDESLISLISSFSGCQTAIFQKVDKGFVLTSSNMTLNSQQDMEGTLFPKSFPAFNQLTTHEYVIENQYINGKWYSLAYKSMNDFFNGQILLREENQSMQTIENIINNKNYKADLFVIDSSGTYLTHPDLYGINIKNTEMFKSIVQSKNNYIRYKVLNEQSGKFEWHHFYFQYFEPFKSYIGLNLSEKVLFETSTGVEKAIFISIIFTLFILSTGILLILRPVTYSIKQVVEKISLMTQGKTVSKLPENRNDEIGDIIQSLNSLIDTIGGATRFAKEIEKGNLEADFSALSHVDELGNSLLNMRNSLLKAKDEEVVRKAEDERRNWATNGIATFADILRQGSRKNIEEFSQEIIAKLVNYMGVAQGGLFITNDNDPENVVIEMVSCFAYNRKKKLQKRLLRGEGLIGRCIDEHETLYLNEIPNDYLTVTSGLGAENPRFLLIIPLKVNEEVFGAIEMASFNAIEKYQIEFAEKVCENIASALSTTRINQKTHELLEQQNEQTEEMAAQEEEMRQTLEEMLSTQEEAERKESNARSFVNTVNHTMIRADFDTKGNLLYANSRFLDMFGYKSKELHQKYIGILFNNEEREQYLQMFHRIAKGGKHFEGEIEFVGKNSPLRLISTFTAKRTDDGSVSEVIFLGINLKL